MKKPWSISTTVRNPERLRDFLAVLKILEGKPFNSENQIKYQILLIQNKFYQPTNLTKTQEKYFPRIQEKFQHIIRINAVKDRDTAVAFGVMGTPTTIIIENGKIKDYFVGIAQPNKILKSLNE